MADLAGNMLVAQSGGPTAVINASVAGAIQEAGRHPDSITEIYGGRNGILGILNEELVDLQEERRAGVEDLKHTPGAALGTCRYRINFKQDPDQAAKDMDRLFEVFGAHDIRYFFYAGGNDSQDTALKVHEDAVRRGYALRVMGIPKTIDNDLPHTDHCPGYGSTIKYVATTVMEVAADVASMATDDGSCCILEVMGRDTGWIAAGSVLAKRAPSDAPHVVLLPEVPLDEPKFLAKVKQTVQQLGWCIVVVGEGLRNAAGKIIGEDNSQKDAFEHGLLSGVGEFLAKLVQTNLGTKTRSLKLGYAQRSAAHAASLTDMLEAVACGEAAVRNAVTGQSGYMIKLVRDQEPPYRCIPALHDLHDIANVVNAVKPEFLSEDGLLLNEKFLAYARPLIEGEVRPPVEGGLPKYVTLERVPVTKVLAARG